MPFKSKAQAGWMFSNYPELAKEWADKTPDMKDLPEKVQSKSKSKSKSKPTKNKNVSSKRFLYKD